MRKNYLCRTVTTLILLSANGAAANVTPPPVNQNIGIKDGVFDNLQEKDCRGCHDGTGTFGTTINTSLPVRHHLKVGKPYAIPSDAPNLCFYPADPGCSTTYECLDCHTLVIGTTGKYEFAPFRNCLLCHWQDGNTERFATVHHRHQKAVQRQCKACHGPIDGIADGHYIPATAKSGATPEPGQGLSTVTNAAGLKRGGCAFCHNRGTDTATSFTAYTNAETHHGTGLVKGPYVNANRTFSCFCHDFTPEVPDPTNDNKITPYAIRKCETCHGINSLHNIAWDANKDHVITPGAELPNYGHVGAGNDCLGCHGGATTPFNTATVVASTLIPAINTLSPQLVPQGVNTPVTVSGTALTNTVGNQTYNAVMRLTNDDSGQEILLPSTRLDEGSLTAVVPPYLPGGSYRVQLVKSTQTSNAMNLTIRPRVAITTASCLVDNNGVAAMTIGGAGFGAVVEPRYFILGALRSGLAITADGMACGVINPYDPEAEIPACILQTWSDTLIYATLYSGVCPTTVTVNNLFDNASATVGTTSACQACHPEPMTLNCAVAAVHLRKNYLDAASYKTETARAGLTCTSVTSNPKDRSRKQN